MRFSLTSAGTKIPGSVSATSSNSTTLYGSTTLDTSVHLDLAGRVSTKTISDPDGDETITYTYDSSGRVSNVTNPQRSSSSSTDGSTSLSYDGLGRVTTITEQDGSARHAYYGGSVSSNGGITTQLCSTSTYGIGYPTLKKNEAGKKRQTWVDAFGHLIEADEPDSSGALTLGTCYKFDVLDHFTEVDQGSQTRTFTFDGLGRLTQETTPEGGTIYEYYTTSGGALCAGNPSDVCRVTDARSITTTYTYDALNRLTAKSYSNSDPSVAYFYDQTSCSSFSGFTITNGKGRQTCMTDGSGASAWSYDSEGHVLTQKRTIGSVTKTISYTYTTGGLVNTITYPSGFAVTNYYNAVGRPTQVSSGSVASCLPYALALASGATYAPQGALANLTVGNCNTTTAFNLSNTYNSRLQTVNKSATRVSDSVKLLDLTYNYVSSSVNDGRVKSVTNNLSSGRSQSYTYDEMDRLATAQSQATSGSDCWGLSYSYDRYANLTAESVTKCSGPSLSFSISTTTNRITNAGFSYDAAGDVTADGSGATYTWNAEGLMASTAGVNYTYDGKDLRVKKDSGTLYWYGVGDEVLAESDASGNITSEYVFFGGIRICRRDPSSGNVYYFLGDRVGSTRVLTDAAGSILEASDYYPYGQERVVSGTGAVNNFKYTGDERDTESGLDHTQYRQLSSALAHWLSPDALGGHLFNPQSWNRYAYVLDDPINHFDNNGKSCAAPDDGGCEEDPPDCSSTLEGCNPTSTEVDQKVPLPPGCHEGEDGNPVCSGRQPNPDRTMRRFRDAVDNAQKMLKKANCLKLFMGPTDSPHPGAAGILQGLLNGNSPYGSVTTAWLISQTPGYTYNAATTPIAAYDTTYDDDGNPVTVFQGWIRATITINDDPDTPFNTTYSENQRAVTILHELGHLMNYLWGNDATWFIDDNSDLPDSTDRSAYNDDLIKDNCL